MTKHLYLAFALLCIFSNTFAQSSIPFELTDQGHIVIKASFNDVEGSFILDTGGGLNLITKKFAAPVQGLQKQDGVYTAFRATGERLTVDLYTAKTLSIGTFREKDPQLTIIDVELGPYAGLISLKSLYKQPFTIDYTNKKVVFETAQSLKNIRAKGARVPLQMEDARDKALDVFAYFTVNDKLRLQFLLDSGAGKDVYRINARYIGSLGVDTANAKKTFIPSEFNKAIGTTIYNAEVRSVAAQSHPAINSRNVKASFITDLIYDGVVSINWIGKQITFDLPNAEMIVLQ
jgi:hypothetical protein